MAIGAFTVGLFGAFIRAGTSGTRLIPATWFASCISVGILALLDKINATLDRVKSRDDWRFAEEYPDVEERNVARKRRAAGENLRRRDKRLATAAALQAEKEAAEKGLIRQIGFQIEEADGDLYAQMGTVVDPETNRGTGEQVLTRPIITVEGVGKLAELSDIDQNTGT